MPLALVHLSASKTSLLSALPALFVLAASPAQADELTVARLSYDSPAACPSKDDFAQSVHLRTTRLRFAPTGPVDVAVTIQNTAQGFDGRVQVTRAEHSWSRHLQDPSCSDLAQALGLVIALAFDPKAKIQLQPAPTPVSPAVMPDTTRALPPRADVPVWAWLVGGGVRWRSAIAPSVRPELSAFLETHQLATGWLAPSVRLTGFYASSAALQTSVGSAAMHYAGGRLHACSSQASIGPLIWVAPCVAVEAGAVAATGSIDIPRSATRPWFALEAGMSLQWRVGRFFSELSASAGLIPSGYRFRFAYPDVVIHEVQGAYGTFGVAAGWQLL